jgi:hypothetical protein
MAFSHQRIVQATAATLSWQGVNQDGDEADPGVVTVGVVRSDGSPVLAAGTPTSGSGSTPRTVTLTAAQTAELDLLTCTWKNADGVTVGSTVVHVVGGVYASLSQIRARDRVLADASTDADETLRRARAEAEHQFENTMKQAFVPRFDVARLNGSGRATLTLPWAALRRVRWVRVWSGRTFTSLSAEEVAAIRAHEAGIAVRPDWAGWPWGRANIEIGYEHGHDTPPPDLQRALIQYVRRGARRHDNPILDQATSFTMVEGGTLSLATPGVGKWTTGIPDVDVVLMAYTVDEGGVA